MTAFLATPQNWPVKRLRFLSRVNKSRVPASLAPEDEVSFVPMAAIGEYGGVDLTDSKALEDVGTGYTPFLENDVLIAKITPCFENGKGALATGLKNGAAYGTTELHVVSCGAALLPEFAFYLSICTPFRRLGEGSMYGAGGQKRVPETFVKDLRFGVPPVEIQRAILAFLNTKLGEIDDLIVKKRGLLALLAEKRSALITHAVTKGIDPTATMKSSGIDWLGGIPAHWEARRFYQTFRLRSGAGITTSDMSPDGTYPVYGGNGIRGATDNWTHNGEYVLIGRQGALCGNVHVANGQFWATEHALVVYPIIRIDTHWLKSVLQAMNLRQYSVATAQPGLSVDNLSLLKLPVPPLSDDVPP
jgi:type I restriction enzyme S subunit